MQPIQINVQVSIGLNSELSALLMSVVNRPAQVAELPAAPRTKKPAKPQPEPEVTNQPTPTDGQATAEKPEPAPEAPAETAEQEPAPEPQPQAPAKEETKEYTEVDVRAAMDRTRKRIEGENYKEKPTARDTRSGTGY